MIAILVLLGILWLFFHPLLEYLASLLIPKQFRRKKDIRGQKILITGAGSGVGRQLAIQFSKYSTCLVLLDINKESLLETGKLLDSGSRVLLYECDVSDRLKVYEVAESIKKDAGDVDIVVNNAGIISGKYLMDLPDEKIVKTMEVNALAHFWICKSFLPAMMSKNRGHIVSIASIASKIGASQLTDYTASKFAAAGFASSLEIELREKRLDGIKVTVVYPAFIDTGLFQGAKTTFIPIMSPKYVAEEIVAGVLGDQEAIYLPPYLKFLSIAFEIFPRWFVIWLIRKTGNINVMKNFTGSTGRMY